MRLQLGPPPADSEFVPASEGWNKLREPGPIGLQLLAVPVMLVTVALLVPAWQACVPGVLQGLSFTIHSNSPQGAPSTPIIAAITAGIIVATAIGALIAVHEVLHALAFPTGGVRFIGVWPTRLLFYAAYHGPMSRNRFLWVMVVPFLVLTITPLALAAILRTSHALVAVTSILNGAFACGDLVGIALVASQVPANAEVRNQGWQTWWRGE